MNTNKEELLNKIEELKDTINKATNEINELKNQVDNIKEKENVWKPISGDEYYFITNDGQIWETVFDNNKYCTRRYDIGNCFKTKKEAERKVFEIQLHRKLELFALENNEKEIDWNNTDNKYYIYYDYIDKYLQISIRNYNKPFDSNVYFSSEELANKAIETFKDDLIRYFTSNE